MDADRPYDSADVSDCSNHSTTTSTTDKDTEPSSDSECKHIDSQKKKSANNSTNGIPYSSNVSPFGMNSSSCSGSNVGATKQSHNPFAVRSSTPIRSLADSTACRPILAPSKLTLIQESGQPNLVSSSTSKQILRPSALSNHTAKLTTYLTNSPEPSHTEPASSFSGFIKDESANPDEHDNVIADSHVNSSIGDGFIFGQNLLDRVQNVSQCPVSSSSTALNLNGASDLLFSAAAAHADTTSQEDNTNGEISPNTSTKSLTESAREYEEAHQAKRKYVSVPVRTGEEEEFNVLQMNCRLFSFDSVQGLWQERGCGQLRLNDMSSLRSRIVIRLQGSLRVVLNTLIWPGMIVCRTSPKTVQFTALDKEHPCIYLVMGTLKDTDLLYNALEWRCRCASQIQNTKENDNEASADLVPSSTCSSSPPHPCSPSSPKRLKHDNEVESSNETAVTSEWIQEKEADSSEC